MTTHTKLVSVFVRAAAATLLVAAALPVVTACSDAGLQPRQKAPATYDDQLRIEANVCASPADDAVFPVKILFVVDTSLSMSVTDRMAVRAKAVTDVLNRFTGNPAVQFAVMSFDAKIELLTQGFTNTPNLGMISSRLSMADRLTDYQGALGAAYTLLSQDMASSSPADRARTKYVVIFFSDGVPDPQCSSRETKCGAGTCPAKQHCRVGQCVPDYMICAVDRKDWGSAFDPPIDEALFPELDAGADYNQESQILRTVDDIVALQDFYRTGEVRIHTGFLFDPAAAADPLAAPFGLDRPGGVDIMTKIAERGFGTFTEFDSASKISFLNVNYTSIKQENALASLFAVNVNTARTAGEQVVDTDGDGLADEVEGTAGTCRAAGSACADGGDSDGDGYSDLVESKNRISGFDPLDAKKPVTACDARGDSDGDGLRDCEEVFLRTDTRLPDSDGDRVPDAMEVKLGLDPLERQDVLGDPDFDGMRTADEIRAHLNPFRAERLDESRDRYLYEVAEAARKEGRPCYTATVRGVRLLTTARGTDATLGKNRVLVYFHEAPADRAFDFGNLRVACVDARYIDGAFKSPASGVVSLVDEDFVRLATFDPERHCKDYVSAP